MTTALVGRRILSVALAVTALGGASVAWACSTQAQAGINGGQTSGPVGTQVTVTGRDFDPGPVQVRWNSKSGQVLGEGQGPSFSVAITIPQAPGGVHYIVAMSTIGATSASLAFEVTTPARTNSNETASSPTGTTSTSATGADEEISTNSPATNPATATNTSQTQTQTQSSTNTAGPTQSTESATNTATSGSSSTQTAAQAPVNAPSTSGARTAAPVGSAAPAAAPRAASANPAVVTSASGQAVFGGSSATPAAPVEADRASAATVSGDTWSGFAAGAKPSLLTNAPATPAPSSGPASGLGLGVGLLGAGVVALFAGFAAAESSRKRALAGAERR